MRQLLVVGSVVAVLSLAAPAGAGERPWYLGLEGGVELDGDSGWAALVTVGRGIASNINLEAEFGYRGTSESGWLPVDIDQASLMMNAVYEAPLSEQVSLALGVGAGADYVSVEYPWGSSESEVELAVQLKLGLNVELSESTDLVANFRYLETVTDSAIDNTTLTIGLRFDL